MKHRNSHLLVGYWSRLRAGRCVPDQADIDPRAVKRLLPYTFILEFDGTRPVYRLAGTALCERFGFELKGTGFLAHWEAGCSEAMTGLLRQSLKTGQPVCLISVAATTDDRMVELETVLAPIGFDGGAPSRFFGLVQMLSDPTPLLGRVIAYERLIGSKFVSEGESLPPYDHTLPPPPPPGMTLKAHPRAPWIRLVVEEDANGLSAFGAGDLLATIAEAFGQVVRRGDLLRPPS